MKRTTARRLLASLTTVALLAYGFPVHAATIKVDGGCTLVDAMTAANTDSVVGGCVAGSGADVIELGGDVSLTSVDNVYLFEESGLPPVLSDITVSGNGFTIERADGAPSFQIFVVVAVGANGTLTLNDVTVRNASNHEAIYNYRGEVNLHNSAMRGNASGAINNYVGQLSISHSELTYNQSHRGAAIINTAGTVTVSNSTLSGNSVTTSGGAIYQREGSLTIANSTLTRNAAGFYGGAILNYRYATVDVTNSTISGNSAGAGGGGIANNNIGGDITVTNSTLSGNSASFGGAIDNISTPYGFVRLKNTIVADSLSGGNCTTDPTLDGGNNFDDDGSCTGAAPIVSGVDFDTTLADNGGPTLTHALLPGSVAIDTVGLCGLPEDQRGFDRDARCDSGAVEFGAVACSTCAAGQLLVGLLSDLRLEESCRTAICHNPLGLMPLAYLDSLPTPAPGDGYYYFD